MDRKNKIVTNLDEVILKLKNNEIDVMTLRLLLRSVLILGAIGSGKTSSSGEYLRRAYLRSGMGGCVMCAKTEEAQSWFQSAVAVGREQDLIYLSPRENYRFDPFLYQMQRTDAGGKDIQTMTNLFTTTVKMGNRLRGGNTRGGGDIFWELSLERLVQSAFIILILSGEEASIVNIVRLLRSIPPKPAYRSFDTYARSKEVSELEQEGEEGSTSFIENYGWWEGSYLIQCLYGVYKKEKRQNLSSGEMRELDVAKQYFLLDFPSLSERTSSAILETFYSYANMFRFGLISEYLANGLNEEVMPERTYEEGKIVILDFPLKTFGIPGLLAQVMYSKCWMDCMERREIDEKTSRSVFYWADEAHLFADNNLQEFLTTARSVRVASVLMTQNISNLYAQLGDEHRVKALLGLISTVIFHQNNDVITNQWASDTIGKSGTARSRDISENYDYQVSPLEFNMLTSGGPLHGNKAEAIVTSLRPPFSNGKNFLKVTFRQYPKNSQ